MSAVSNKRSSPPPPALPEASVAAVAAASAASQIKVQQVVYPQEKKQKMTSQQQDNPSASLGYIRNPEELFNDPNCKAYVLSISNQRANMLLWTDIIKTDINGNDIIIDKKTSIVKMTVVPGHKDKLVSSNHHVEKKITNILDLNVAMKDMSESGGSSSSSSSKSILQFLSHLDCSLTSESGAEYSYYTAKEKGSNDNNAWWQNPIDKACQIFGLNTSLSYQPTSLTYQIELISPASSRQIERTLPSPSLSLIEETPEIYEKVVEPFIQKIVDSGSLSWVTKIIKGEKETERLLYNDNDYIINIDTKWRSHPDTIKVPNKEEWYKHSSIEDLYCLGIVKDSSIRTLRDLRGNHIPMLQSMVLNGLNVIERTYGVMKDQIRIFVHYQPQFYHFHIHYTRIHNEIGCQVERGHLISDIIQNLMYDTEFYKKRTITHKISTSSEIYFQIQQM